jgi:hypothetical protein
VRVVQGSTWNVDGSGETFDGRPVEADAFFEGALKFGGSDRDGFEETEHIGKPQPDESDVPFLQRAEHEFLLSIHTWKSMHAPLSLCYRRGLTP